MFWVICKTTPVLLQKNMFHVPTSQNERPKGTVFYGLRNIFSSIFDWEILDVMIKPSLIRYRISTNFRKSKPPMGTNKEAITMINISWNELGDHRELLHNLDFILMQMSYTYAESFCYLSKAKNMFTSLADVIARIAVLCTGITCIQVDIDKVYNYADAWATHTVTSILILQDMCDRSLRCKRRNGCSSLTIVAKWPLRRHLELLWTTTYHPHSIWLSLSWTAMHSISRQVSTNQYIQGLYFPYSPPWIAEKF